MQAQAGVGQESLRPSLLTRLRMLIASARGGGSYGIRLPKRRQRSSYWGLVLGEIHPPHLQPGTLESWRQSASGILSCQIRIECDKDGTVRPIGELGKLCAGQVHAEGATGIDKARLPENRQIRPSTRIRSG